MGTILTSKGRVTLPKRVRDALALSAGDKVSFAVNERGEVVIQRAEVDAETPALPERLQDRFDWARGRADFKWGSTAEYMKFIRGDDYEINGEP